MKLYNIVKVYTSTVGTGTVTLGSAVPSFITFATAGVITGSTVSYAIEDGNNREVGTGVYTSGAETLTRTVVTSTNSNNAITLSGNAVVFITGLAADLSSDTAATANTLVIRNGSGNFALGTPTSGTLTNCTGLPVSTGISGLGTNVATFLATPSSANLAGAVTDETGSGALVFANTPVLVTPAIGSGGFTLAGSSSGTTTVAASATASGTITIPASTDTLVGKATTDTFTNKTFDTAGAGNVLKINGTQVSAVTGTGSVVLATSPTLVTPLLGTPTSGTLTNCTGLPIASGVSGLGTGVTTALAVNVGSAGALVVNGGVLGTPSSGTLTSCTGLPISTGVSGLGAGVATFLGTPSSANLAAAITDETGTGSLLFNTSPVLQGNVGIGRTGTWPLDVNSTVSRFGTTGTLSYLQFGANATDLNNYLIGCEAGAFAFYQGRYGGASSERMRIDSSGNVGIGTASPATESTNAKLAVVGSLNQSASTLATSNSNAGFTVRANASSGYQLAVGATSVDGSPYIQGVNFNGGAAPSNLTLQGYGGNVGIGTASPDALLTVNTIASFGDGAQTTPSIAHKGDLNTGFWFPAADNIAVSVGGVESFRFDSAGRFQAGGTTGLERINVVGSYQGYGWHNTGAAANEKYWRHIVHDANRSLMIQAVNDAYNAAATPFEIVRNAGTYTTQYVRIAQDGGNVGIGTTSPVLALHVVGTQGGPATSGTTPTGTARFVTVNSVMDIGSRSNGNTWMQVTDRTNLAASYNLELNPNGGNVGIGTASPLTKLQVGAVAGLGGTDGNVTLSAGTNMIYATAISGAALTWNANTNGGFSNTVMAQLKPRQDTSANYNLDVFCGTWNNNNSAGTAIATFQSTGNVGIGTTSPGNKLHVSGGDANGWVTFIDNSNNNARLQIGSRVSNSASLQSVRIDTAAQTDLVLQPIAGNVLIGYTTSNGLYLLQVNSQIFATNATIATSDGRYKENISSIKSGLDVVGKLNPVSFTWKQHEIHNFDSGTQVGFIAQDVQAALADEPYLESVVKSNEVELKDGTKEEFYGLSDAKLIPILVKAIQELKAKIDILEARN